MERYKTPPFDQDELVAYLESGDRRRRGWRRWLRKWQGKA